MRDTPLLSAVLVAVVLIPAGGCYKTNVKRALDPHSGAPDATAKVLADYQPWFGSAQHISVGYSTQDPDTLRRQIHQARDMGIYAFAVDWYGSREPFLDHSYALLQQIASQNHFHVCLMYDETQEDNGHATEDALAAMDEAYKNYVGPQAPARDAYLLYGNHPVIFIFPKRGHTDWNRVRQVVNGWETPPLLIYKDEPPSQYTQDFDGEYAWVHPGPKGWTSDGSEWGKQYLDTFYQRMRRNHPDKLAVGGAWPGFDDSKASWGINRHMDRRCGQTFHDTLQMFQQYDDGSVSMPFLLIATWNDYEEGTEIEGGVASCGNRSNPNGNVQQ